MNQKKLTVKVIATDKMTAGEMVRADGWGEQATTTELSGEIAQLIILKDGESQFGIRILEDGSIIITSYRTYYTHYVNQNLHLNNERPWVETTTKKSKKKPRRRKNEGNLR